MGGKTKSLVKMSDETTETHLPARARAFTAAPGSSGQVTRQETGSNMATQHAVRSDAAASLKSALMSLSVTAPAAPIPSTASWLASLGIATTDTRDDTAEIASIDAQLTSLVISDTYRAELEQRRSEVELVVQLRKEAAARLDLIALEQEAQQRTADAAHQASTPTTGPTSITVPLRTLFAVPDPYDQYMLYFQIVKDPGSEQTVELAGRYIVDQYLTDKLDWLVTIDIIQPEGSVWFEFTVHNEPLVDTRKLQLPLSALDAVSPESLAKVSQRATLIVEAASFEAAADEIVKTISEKAAAMIKEPEDYARNEAIGLSRLTDSYVKRLSELESACGPGQDWIQQRLAIRHRAMQPVVERVKESNKVTNDYHNEILRDMPTYAGETYDSAISESSNVVEEYGWRILGGIGDIVTLGGQSNQAENARMYRRGEISRSDYKRNWVLNIVRVGATAVITALTAGRATGPAMRFLGLGAETSAAAATAGGVEGIVGGLTQSVTSDAFAKAVSLVSDSPGVVAFHERTIGGLDAWLASVGWGGTFGMAFGLGGHMWERYRAQTPNQPKPTDHFGAAADQPDVIGLKIKDEPNGDFAFFVEDPVSGKRLVVQGNRLAGNATVIDPLTGELVGSMRDGVIARPTGSLPPAADAVVASTEPVYGPPAPADTPAQIGPAPRPQLGAGELPTSRTLEIEELIASEIDLFDPIGVADPLDANQFSTAGAPPTASSLAEVDLSQMPLQLEARYVERFPNYVSETLARGHLPRLGNLRDYIRFRYGIESGQLARGYRPTLRAGNPGGMSIEARVAIEAGRDAEKMQALLRTSNKNNQKYLLSFYDPVRQKTVNKTIIPDFMPTGQRDARGHFVNAATAGDAFVIADSKYTWDVTSQVQLDDQVAAMMILARDNNKPFVFLLGEGRDVSASVRAFAQATGTEIYVVPDVSGTIR